MADIAIGDEESGGAFLYVNEGGGTFGRSLPIADPPDDPDSIAIAGMDGDGALDIVLGDDDSPRLVLVQTGRDGRLWRRSVR